MLTLSLDSKPYRPILAYQDMLILPCLAFSASPLQTCIPSLSVSLSRGPFPPLGLMDGGTSRAVLVMQLSSVSAALGKACEKERCHPTNPGAANKAKPRQPQKHQHSWVHVPLSPANRPEEDTEVSFSRPGCSPTRLISLNPVLIRAPKLRDSEPKLILFQSDFVRALFAF